MIEPEMWSKIDVNILANKEYMEKYAKIMKWNNQESILEFGMGCGRNTRETLMPHLPMDFKEFIGSDVTTPMVEHSKMKIVHPKIKIIQFDIACEAVPSEFEQRFDHIFSFMTMHWVQNTRQGFSNIHKMLKPGGEMFITFVERPPFDEVYDLLSKHPKWGQYGHEKYISPFHFYDDVVGEYKKALCESGFTDFDFEVEDRVYQHPNERAFEEFCYCLNPIIAKIPKEEVDEYKKLYVELMKKNSNFTWVTKFEETKEDIIQTSFKLLAVLARKSST